MKNIIYILLLFTIIISCSESNKIIYDDSKNKIYFSSKEEDSIVHQSFAYVMPEINRDTVWFYVRSIGFITDFDKTIRLKQISDVDSSAVSGIDYVAFDNTEVAKHYIIEKGESVDSIPIILLRTELLKTKTLQLKVSLEANSDFELGIANRTVRTILFTQRLSKPTNWTGEVGSDNPHNLGAFHPYGAVKHQFLIDVTGYKWDNEFLEPSGFIQTNSSYREYVKSSTKKALAELNEERKILNNGKDDPLKEDDGTIVTI